jgi:hypothetical protein
MRILRYENYSDFGDNFGKLTRYKLNSDVAIRVLLVQDLELRHCTKFI